MLKARPLEVFRIGNKQILTCQLVGENPMKFLDHDFAFYSRGQLVGRIKIVGMSTASDNYRQVYDFNYSGDEILPEQLDELSFITDEVRETAN